MGPAMWWMVGGLGALLAVPLVAHGIAYVRAALRRHRARRACPFEDDAEDALSVFRAAQLVVTESALWCSAVVTALRPPPESVPAASTEHIPVVVLAPPLLPRSSVRTLVARLRRDGFRVICPRLTTLARSPADRVRALDQALRASWDDGGARVVDVVAPAGAAAVAAAHLASGGSGVPTIRRLLIIGTSGAGDPVVPPPTEVIAVYSPDDPLLAFLEALPRPGVVHVAIRGFGRLGLLHAPHVYGLIREHLLAPPACPSSWTSVAS